MKKSRRDLHFTFSLCRGSNFILLNTLEPGTISPVDEYRYILVFPVDLVENTTRKGSKTIFFLVLMSNWEE